MVAKRICSWVWKAGGPKFGSKDLEFWIDGKNYASAAAVGLNGGTITPTKLLLEPSRDLVL